MKVLFCSSAIIKNKNGEILLMSRKQKKSFVSSWEFPGGKLKNNENFAVALFRELKEELNIKIDINKLSNYEFFKHQYRSFLLMMKHMIVLLLLQFQTMNYSVKLNY